MSEKKKIIFLITRAEVGGAQNHVNQLIEKLHQCYDCVLISGSNGSLIEALKPLGIKIHIIPEVDAKTVFPALYRLHKIIKREQADLIHTHSAIASFTGRIVAKFLGIKTLYTVHGWHFVPNAVWQRQLTGKLLERLARPLTDHWITVSEFDKNLGLQNKITIQNKTSVIVNSVTNIDYKIKKRETIQALNIAFVGRASYQKNALAAVEILKQCNTATHLTFFCANGDYLNALKESIKSNHKEEQCTLIENEHNAGMQLQKFDVLLITSKYEGMPLCALEAMRFGLPIVASNVCGMNEIVQHRHNGYLFNLENTIEAADYLTLLQENPEISNKMGENSRRLFLRYHQEGLMISKTTAIYEQLLTTKSIV